MVVKHDICKPSSMVFVGMTRENAIDPIQSPVAKRREDLGATFKEVMATVDGDQISAALANERESGRITDHV
jgi:hypothetical protein